MIMRVHTIPVKGFPVAFQISQGRHEAEPKLIFKVYCLESGSQCHGASVGQLHPCCPAASASEAVRTLLKILQDSVVAASWTAVASRRTEQEDGRAAVAGRWAVD